MFQIKPQKEDCWQACPQQAAHLQRSSHKLFLHRKQSWLWRQWSLMPLPCTSAPLWVPYLKLPLWGILPKVGKKRKEEKLVAIKIITKTVSTKITKILCCLPGYHQSHIWSQGKSSLPSKPSVMILVRSATSPQIVSLISDSVMHFRLSFTTYFLSINVLMHINRLIHVKFSFLHVKSYRAILNHASYFCKSNI